jgi:hypothetical protein
MYFQGVDSEKYLALKKQIIDSVLECKNVKLYDFETAFHITRNFNNYKDRNHYSGKISSWIISEISKNNYRVTAETKDLFIEALRKEWKTFNFQKEYDRLAAAYSKK